VTRFEDVIGHQPSLDLLRRMLERGRVPHALLFQGPEGVGKGTVARALEASLLCTADSPRPCGSCASCRALDAGAHPDTLWVRRPPKDTDFKRKDWPARAFRDGVADEDRKRNIAVDMVRYVAGLAGRSPRLSGRRVFVFDPADAMLREPQNALLKTLEEPPGNTVLILLASRPHSLLPTVRSRCFVLGLPPLRATDLTARLRARGMDPREALVRASLAEGCPGRALELDIETLRERRGTVLDALEALAAPSPGLADLSELAGALAGKTEPSLVEGLDFLEGLLRDASRAALNAEEAELIHADLSDRLSALGRRLGARRAAALAGAVDRLRAARRLNLNRMLVAESLLAAVAGGPLP
jgi:DNA polymerase-3 subunit delta'